MAIRNINYTVTADSITPATEQFAGTQEEHNATSLVFTFNPALITALTAYIADYELKYRFDVYDGEGNVLQGDDFTLVENGTVLEAVTLDLSEPAARYGGKASVYLVITAYSGDETKLNLYSFPAKLRFNNLPDGGEGDNNAREAITTLAEAAKSAANAADNSAIAAAESEDVAEIAKQQTLEARFALENGSTFIFDGGDSEGAIDIELVVDSALSDVSENPVQNKVIKGYVDGKTVIDTAMSGSSENAVQNKVIQAAINAAIAAATLAAHPIGSFYISEVATEPSTLFGGTWVAVHGRFLLASGENEANPEGSDYDLAAGAINTTAGDMDGEDKHKNTVDETAKHIHSGLLVPGGPLNIGNASTGLGVSYGNTGGSAITTTESGGDLSHNNMPPYLSVYMWKRTA